MMLVPNLKILWSVPVSKLREKTSLIPYCEYHRGYLMVSYHRTILLALSSLFNLSEWTWPTRNVKEIGQMLFDVVKRRNWCLGSKIWQHNKLMAMRSFSTIFFPSSSSLTNQEKLLKTDFIFGLNLFRVLKKLKVLFETAVQSVVGYQCWKGRKLWT